MPEKQKGKKVLCDKRCRNTEYYGLQSVFDDLYSESLNGAEFDSLMPIILREENIRLAFRTIKTNDGSRTPGTDGLTIADIERLSVEDVVSKVKSILYGNKNGYQPVPVRRVEIPKPYDHTKTRPLGIPGIWDRLVQQCIRQVMEPIVEAKLSRHCYGFRPNLSTEEAIAEFQRRIWQSHMYYVVEFDVKGFFDNVNHAKLIRQIWSLGIHDKKLLSVIRAMLSAPTQMRDGTLIVTGKGTPQGGILSPLLANIVLNELDHWVESQWIENPLCLKLTKVREDGSLDRTEAYKTMRTTKLKEMYIVRYADDFRILCESKETARKIKIAVTDWLLKRLKLEVSQEKTRIVNVRRHYSEFLGIRIKAVRKGKGIVTRSHVGAKQLPHKTEELISQAKKIAKPAHGKTAKQEIETYNAMVMGMQNYYDMATSISIDLSATQRRVSTVLYNRLKPVTKSGGGRLAEKGRKLTPYEQERYGDSEMLTYEASTGEPIYPIGYVQYHPPRRASAKVNCYSQEGRSTIHTNLQINTSLMLGLMRQPPPNLSIQGADNCISRFSEQWGKCKVSGVEFSSLNEIVCHHINPRRRQGLDRYNNIILVRPKVEDLILAQEPEDIRRLLDELNLNSDQMESLNRLRSNYGNYAIDTVIDA